MPQLSFSELEKVRNTASAALSGQQSSGTTILVGMGTCGIAAGAKTTFATFTEEIRHHALAGVVVKQTGCIGQCYSEPTVEVQVAGMPPVIYGDVNADTAKLIVRKHIIEKTLVEGHIFDHPSPDIIGRQ
jgi:NADP-reducing hydrogenase subunit HndB